MWVLGFGLVFFGVDKCTHLPYPLAPLINVSISPPTKIDPRTHLLHPFHLREQHHVARLQPVAVLLQHGHHAVVGLLGWGWGWGGGFGRLGGSGVVVVVVVVCKLLDKHKCNHPTMAS